MGIKQQSYARMRYDDPEGDVGRQKRQREVIGAIVTKLLKLDGYPVQNMLRRRFNQSADRLLKSMPVPFPASWVTKIL